MSQRKEIVKCSAAVAQHRASLSNSIGASKDGALAAGPSASLSPSASSAVTSPHGSKRSIVDSEHSASKRSTLDSDQRASLMVQPLIAETPVVVNIDLHGPNTFYLMCNESKVVLYGLQTFDE